MIRDATKDDYSNIARLNILAYQEFSHSITDNSWVMMQKNLTNIEERSVKAQFLVFCEGMEIVGSAAYCPPGNGDPGIFDKECASVLLVAVHPERRGNGIARNLLKECIVRAKKGGATNLALFTSELMVSAQNLYQSLGFKKDKELPQRNGVRYFTYLLPLAMSVAET
ncbi:MAG: GNAT family N-acetyltransferase [Burkholderiales bacterium]